MKAKDLFLGVCEKAGHLCIGISISAFMGSQALRADTITNRPSADTTLFETYPNNNLGATDLTSGSTAAGLRSRALIKFDIAAVVPPTATIGSVTLTVTATRQPSDGSGSVYRLFRVLQPWGEGNKTGVHGAPADPDETSWNDRFASEAGGNWDTPGAAAPKDFSPVPGASLFVGGEGRFTFSSNSNLVADAQFWLNNSPNNYGWIVVSDAESVPQTVTHFSSREDPINAPMLVIDFTLPATGQRPNIDHVAMAANTFILGFNAAAERSFTVQYLESLSTTNWQTLTNIPAQFASAEVMVADPIHGSQRFYRAVQSEPRTNLVFIPSGTFRMGSPADEVDRFAVEGPQTAVTISRSFWMGRYEVTQGEYEAVMGNNPSHFTGDPNLPVEQVAWSDATNYCAQLTRRERAKGRIATDDIYRLPTEAEWEYACRAGTSTRFSYGDDPGYMNLSNYAWYSDNSAGMTHPVGQKVPNLWGLYDMHGNVLNWCQDWWGAYPGGSAVDTQGPDTGSDRVIRGGSWLRIPGHCRSAFRRSFNPETRNILIGFRVVLAPGPP